MPSLWADTCSPRLPGPAAPVPQWPSRAAHRQERPSTGLVQAAPRFPSSTPFPLHPESAELGCSVGGPSSQPARKFVAALLPPLPTPLSSCTSEPCALSLPTFLWAKRIPAGPPSHHCSAPLLPRSLQTSLPPLPSALSTGRLHASRPRKPAFRLRPRSSQPHVGV